ncbi:hypothetical protein ACHAXS_012353 [Conticribra weissflogii]
MSVTSEMTNMHPLENELCIPPTATLSIPSSIPFPIKLVFALQWQDAVKGNLVEIVTIAGPNSSTENNEVISTCLSIESSMRSSADIPPKCIIVGRQASTVDVRVDHKSVSRRHTAFYYRHGHDNKNSSVLVIQDLGGKHGTYVDDRRLDKNGTMELPLLSGDVGLENHVIRFGNAPVTCKVYIPKAKEIDANNSDLVRCSKENMQQNSFSEEYHVERKEIESNDNNEAKSNDDEKKETDVATTREAREAQIAAMIASLDSAPTYKPYIPPKKLNENTANGSTSSLNGGDPNETSIQNGVHHNGSNDNNHNLPITSSITLSPGSNSFTSSDGTNTPLQVSSAVATLCFEPSGSRLVAGHRDGTIRFYDFHGMKPTAPNTDSNSSSEVIHAPFRIVDSDNDPLDQTGRHVLTAIGPSPTGSQWIVGTTSSQPKVLDREGRTTIYHFCKGDNYVTDASNTKGHTAGVTGVAFHPLVKDICWTCGLDGSIRQWDLSGKGRMQFGKLICQKVLAKCKNEKGQRTQIVSCLGAHPSGRKLVVGTACGSIQIWNCFGGMVSSRPLGAVYSAHGGTKPVTFVGFNVNGERIVSRSESDDTVRVWDAVRMEKGVGSTSRKFSDRNGGEDGQHPPSILLAICCGLPALNEAATCAFSPDGKTICAGTSVDRGAENDFGKLKFYRLPEEEKRSKTNKDESTTKFSKKIKTTAILEPLLTLDVAKGASVLGVSWHPKLNQIAFGTSNGT